MDPFEIALLTVGFLAAYLVLGIWVFVAILMVGISALALLLDFPLARLGAIMRSTMWKTASSYELASVPMFILMGEIIFRTNISDKLFRGPCALGQFCAGAAAAYQYRGLHPFCRDKRIFHRDDGHRRQDYPRRARGAGL